MTNSEDNPPPAVGVYWIKEEHYPAMLLLFDDGPANVPIQQSQFAIDRAGGRGAGVNDAFF